MAYECKCNTKRNTAAIRNVSIYYDHLFLDCNAPLPVDGYVIDTTATPTTFGSTASVSECAVDYKGSPTPNTIECQANGEWSAPNGCSLRGEHSSNINLNLD